MQGLGKGGGGHGGGGGHHGGGGGHHGGGGFRGGRGFRGGGAYFAPGYPGYWGGYPYYDSYPLQVVVPENCEESVRSGCYQRWSQDPVRMAQCVRDGYKGCGVSGLGIAPASVAKAAIVGIVGAGAVAGVVGAALLKKNKAAGAGLGAALAGGYAYWTSRDWVAFKT